MILATQLLRIWPLIGKLINKTQYVQLGLILGHLQLQNMLTEIIWQSGQQMVFTILGREYQLSSIPGYKQALSSGDGRGNRLCRSRA